ncbi:MAG: sulfocyanin-like copper-binding protein [Mycobacteriales bacterium]
MRARVALLGMACSAVLVGAACGSSTHPQRGPVLTVTDKDFNIALSPSHVPAGWVNVNVFNQGPDTHEVILVRSKRAEGTLPLRHDGITVDEEGLEAQTVTTVDDLLPGRHRTLRLYLKPGSYELFCNMSGHYRTGMHTILIVTATS